GPQLDRELRKAWNGVGVPRGSTDVTRPRAKNGGNNSAPSLANCAPNWMRSDTNSRLLILGGSRFRARLCRCALDNLSGAYDSIHELSPKRTGDGLAKAGLGRGRIIGTPHIRQRAAS